MVKEEVQSTLIIAKEAALRLSERYPSIPLINRVYDERITDKVKKVEVFVSKEQFASNVETFSFEIIDPAMDAFSEAMLKDKATGFLKLPALPPSLLEWYPQTVMVKYKNVYLLLVMSYDMAIQRTLIRLEIAYSVEGEN